jgi:deoxyadenosine/deoxycytidine kinase
MDPIICCIDGNIGAGKTTVLQELKRRGHIVFEEDVDDWLPLLERFYADQARWSFALQLKILHSLSSQYERMKCIKAPVVFVECSPKSCSIFSRNAHDCKFMTSVEYNLFNDYYRSLNPWKPDVLINLKTSVDKCLERISLRSRVGETVIDRNYLSQLESLYAEVFDETETVLVDGHQSPEQIADQILTSIFV